MKSRVILQLPSVTHAGSRLVFRRIKTPPVKHSECGQRNSQLSQKDTVENKSQTSFRRRCQDYRDNHPGFTPDKKSFNFTMVLLLFYEQCNAVCDQRAFCSLFLTWSA